MLRCVFIFVFGVGIEIGMSTQLLNHYLLLLSNFALFLSLESGMNRIGLEARGSAVAAEIGFLE